MKLAFRIISVLVLAVILLLIYGSVIEPRFLLDEKHYDVQVPNLPEAWEGKKLALLADFQVGMWWGNTEMIRKSVQRIIDNDTDIVLIAGDFVYTPDSAIIHKAVSLIAPLADAGIPVVAVLGNHDFSMMKKESTRNDELADYLEAMLSRAGVHVLENESLNVNTPGNPLFITGIGSAWAERANFRRALDNIPANDARIIFMHNPISFDAMKPHEAPFTLAGHTHGGQIRLPVFSSSSWLDIARPREVIADGWSDETHGAEGNRIYVTRGTGFSLIPVRLFCRPELTIFTLQKTHGQLPNRESGEEEKN